MCNFGWCDGRWLLYQCSRSFWSCFPELPSFGQPLSLISDLFPPHCINGPSRSSSKPRVVAPKHAHCCVTLAISRVPAKKKAGLSRVLMYVLLLLSSFLIADFLPQDRLPLELKRGTVPLYRTRIQQGRIRTHYHPHIFEGA